MGKSVIFGVNRRSLVHDMSARLDSLGLDHGIIMANHPRRKPWLNVQIASTQTLLGREHVHADIIIADEAHFTITTGWFEIFERYPDALVIGLTATPIRSDGRGLGRYFDCLIEGPSVAQLTADGYLVPAIVYGSPGGGADMSGVAVTAGGEYEKRGRAEVTSKPKLIGDIVEHWLRIGRGEPTVCFADNIAQSEKIRDRFVSAGVRCKHVDASTPDSDRADTWRRLQDYDIEIVCSVGIISYGWDAPLVTTMIDAAPTASLQRAIQKWGRILRPAPGKTRGLVLDHANNTLEHGFVDDEREWTLKDGYKPKKKKPGEGPGICYCKKCLRPFRVSLDRCPECKEPRLKLGREIVTVAGQLREIAPANQYYRCQHCEGRGILGLGESYASRCPRCGVAALAPLSREEPVLSPAELGERRSWFMRAAESAALQGFGPERACVQYLARWKTHAPKRWREDAARTFSDGFGGLGV